MEFPITIDSQEQFDGLVKDRLAREKAKYADYDDLKTAAEAFEEQKTALEQQIADAVSRAETAEGKVQEFETEKQISSWRDEVAKAAGVPADALRGSTKEEFEAHAEVLKPLVTAATAGPIVRTVGDSPNPQTSEESEFVTSLFGGD